MPSQSELPFTEIAPDNPNVASLVGLLRNNPVWLTSAQLVLHFALVNSENNRRWIRSLAESASPEIICGQLGYKHISHATPDEQHHCVSWLVSQGKKMIRRGLAIQRRAHQVVG